MSEQESAPKPLDGARATRRCRAPLDGRGPVSRGALGLEAEGRGEARRQRPEFVPTVLRQVVRAALESLPDVDLRRAGSGRRPGCSSSQKPMLVESQRISSAGVKT